MANVKSNTALEAHIDEREKKVGTTSKKLENEKQDEKRKEQKRTKKSWNRRKRRREMKSQVKMTR